MGSYFVSGASSGLGREMARHLTARGDDVAVAARRLPELESLAREVESHPGTLWFHTLDVTDAPAVRNVMERADAELGGLDVVIVNAGRGRGSKIGVGEFDNNRAVVDVNLVGALAQIDVAMELFRHRGRGHLVLVSSLAAHRGLPGSSAVYSATKAALASIGESLRLEMGPGPIKVTTLRPGYIRTPLTERNRSRLVTELKPATAALIAAIDAGKGDVAVPAWPWAPLGAILKLVPDGLLRRFA